MFVGEMNLKKWIANSLFPYAAIVEVVDGDLLGTEEDHENCEQEGLLIIHYEIRASLFCRIAQRED
ncbi:unnamed protein product [Prunus armeniaca]